MTGRSTRAASPLDIRLAPAALGTWGVCLVILRTSSGPPALAAAALLGVLAAAWPRSGAKHRTAWRGWASLSIALGCLITLAAGGVAYAQVAHRSKTVESLLEFTEPGTRVTVRLTSDVKPGSAGHGAHAVLTAATSRHRHLEVALPVYLMGADPTWRAGEVVTLTGKLSAGAEQLVFLRVDNVSDVAAPRGVLVAVDRLREGVRQATSQAPPQARGLVPGVSIGDDRRLPAHMQEAMRTTSLTHVTAVSGAHVAVVIGTILFLLARAPLGVRAGVAACVLGAMVLVVLPTPSVLRAAGMGTLTLIALAGRRPRLAVPVLFTVIPLLLAYDPWLATSIGFALSVSATLGILAWSAPIAQFLGGTAVARAVAVPLAAQACCSPLLLTFDASLATYSIPANMLAVPALAPATILGLASAVTSMVSVSAAALLGNLAGYFTGWIAAVAMFFAGLPGAKTPWLEGSLGVVLLILLTLGVAVVLRRSRVGRTWQA